MNEASLADEELLQCSVGHQPVKQPQTTSQSKHSYTLIRTKLTRSWLAKNPST